MFFLIILSFNVFGEEEISLDRKMMMSNFDEPLLLGKWASERRYDNEGNKYAMTLFLASDYSYSLLYAKNNKTTSFDYGMFSMDKKNLKLMSSLTNMILEHKIEYNYNKLTFGKMPFIKYPEIELSGNWFGLISNNSDSVQVKNLTLTPNFLFKVNFQDGSGKTKEEIGVYVVEQNRILFLYETGSNIGSFELKEDQLSLNMEDGELLVKMKRESAM